MNAKTAESDVKLDLREEVCPYTFIRTKLALENMRAGQILEVTLRGTAIENVPRSVKDEGHSIVSVKKDGETFTFFIRKNEEKGGSV